MATGVFLDSTTLGSDIDLSGIASTLDGAWTFHPATAPGETAERMRAATVVVTNKVRVDEDAISAARDLRLICIAATGTDNVDIEAARRRGIAVCNVRGYATPSVVQHVFALLLALATRVAEYREAVRAGRWQESPHFSLLDFPIREIAGRRLGIVGYGELGRAVAQGASCFGMEVVVAARPGAPSGNGRVPLRALLPDVDVLTLHCPLTDETRGLIGAREIALMKPGAFLINTARGGIVDETALAEALRRGHLGGAGVDCLTQEPPRAGNPLLAPDIPNLIVTPHTAWASREARQRMADALSENILSFLAGQPRNLVT